MTADFYFLRSPTGQTYAVNGLMRLGRDPVCQVTINDPLVSRVHATIWPEAGSLRVRDEGSRNGTYVNGRRLEPGQAFNLRPGDRLQLGEALVGVAVATTTPAYVGAAGTPGPSLRAPGPVSRTLDMVMPPATQQLAPPPAPARAGGRALSPIWLALGGCAAVLTIALCAVIAFLVASGVLSNWAGALLNTVP